MTMERKPAVLSSPSPFSFNKLNDDAIPRMLRWVCQQSPKSQTISHMFDSSMLIIKAVIKMTPEEEQLRITSGEFFENLRSCTIVQSKNGGSKRGRESDEGDRKRFEGLVDYTLESEEVDAKTEDVDTCGIHHWLRMPKEDDTSNEVKHIEVKKKDDKDVHTVGTPPWLRMPNEDDTSNVVKVNIELEKPIDMLVKKVQIGLEEPIDVVDNEVEIEDNGKKLLTHFDSNVTKIEQFSTQRPHVRPARRKRASVYLSTPFTTLPKRSTTSTTTTSQCEPIVYDPMHKILDVDLDRLKVWIIDKRTNDERLLVAKWLGYKECIKENCPFDWKEEYRLVDYVVGSKEDFQDPWTSVVMFTLHSMSMLNIGFYYA
ncbi:Ulp1-like peptidase [Cucumis melo var. makuwa]|uniref:Ulp1-like peptidase n=1 Tax=Cucumis melo var. makuwa TaxID=1194695 RepID=A0A5A7T6T7_CUCMM|nr:Ulp1-like peptidase [Cucumis melo var. makuwa]